MQNPNWIRAFLASFMLAILLRVGLGIPFINSFIAIGIIYLTQVVLTELQTGAKATWTGIKFSLGVLLGVLIFVTLRYIVAKVTGLYPAHSYEAINSGGGFKDILVGKNFQDVILFEILFAFVGGYLVVAQIKGKSRIIGAIFGVYFVVLVADRAFHKHAPKTAEALPSKDQLDEALARKAAAVTTYITATPTPTPIPAAYHPPASTKPVIAYVTLDKCTTPCTREVKYDYRIRTDGEAYRVKYSGCDWVDRSAKGNFTPSCFHPGPADFVSLETNPAIEIEIQKKITVEGGR